MRYGQQLKLNHMAQSNHYCKVKSTSRERGGEVVSSKTLETKEVLNELFESFSQIFSGDLTQLESNESKDF